MCIRRTHPQMNYPGELPQNHIKTPHTKNSPQGKLPPRKTPPKGKVPPQEILWNFPRYRHANHHPP